MSGGGYPEDMEIWGSFTPRVEPVYIPKIPIKNQLGIVGHPWDLDVVQYPAKYKAIKDMGITDICLYSDAYANKDINGNYMLSLSTENVQTPKDQRPVILERTGVFDLQLPRNTIIRISGFNDEGGDIM